MWSSGCPFASGVFPGGALDGAGQPFPLSGDPLTRRVVIRRGDPDHEVVSADVGDREASLDIEHLTRLDAEGHLLDGRPPRGPAVRWVRPSQGVVLELVRQRRPVGRLIVTFHQGQWLPPVIRLALATIAHALATTTGPAVRHHQ